MIEISDLFVSYDGDEVLHGVGMSFPTGKISVLIGPNGCGKSTTIRSIVRLTEDARGTIKIDGTDIDGLSAQELARKAAYLPQSHSISGISVARLVMHGRFPYLSYPRRYRKEDYEKVDQALEWMGISDLRHRRMDDLSGGQRQKAYLAMALAQDTDIILMDEPTTFLDIRNQIELLERSRMLADSGKTIVMILHDLDAVLRYADHVVLMDSGKAQAEGSAEEVLKDPALASAFGIVPRFFEAEDGLHCYVTK